MIELHPQIIQKNGKKEYVVIPYKEFIKVQEALEDYEDLQVLRAAKKAEQNAPTMSLAEVKEKLGVSKTRSKRNP